MGYIFYFQACYCLLADVWIQGCYTVWPNLQHDLSFEGRIVSTAKKGRVDINAELKEGMIASFIKGKRVEMSTVAMTMTKSISHIGTHRKASWHVLHEDVLRGDGKHDEEKSVLESFHCRGAMFLGFVFSVPVQECNKLRDQKPWWVPQDSINCVCINVKSKTPDQKSLPRKEGPTNNVSLGPQEREKLEKKNYEHRRSYPIESVLTYESYFFPKKIMVSLVQLSAILGAMLQQSSIPVI